MFSRIREHSGMAHDATRPEAGAAMPDRKIFPCYSDLLCRSRDWQQGKKKRTDENIDPGISQYYPPDQPVPLASGAYVIRIIQAGFLTPGSSSSRAFPVYLKKNQWHSAGFVPGHSGGPVSDSHGVPCQALSRAPEQQRGNLLDNLHAGQELLNNY